MLLQVHLCGAPNLFRRVAALAEAVCRKPQGYKRTGLTIRDSLHLGVECRKGRRARRVRATLRDQAYRRYENNSGLGVECGGDGFRRRVGHGDQDPMRLTRQFGIFHRFDTRAYEFGRIARDGAAPEEGDGLTLSVQQPAQPPVPRARRRRCRWEKSKKR
jgi:hypothetical protein